MDSATVSTGAETRISSLRQGLQRMQALLGAENAATATTGTVTAQGHTALEGLLAQKTAIAPRTVKPYEEIAPGVTMGYNDKDNGCWVVADFAPAVPAAPGTARQGARLGLHPVFAAEKATRRVTLETTLAKGAFTPGAQIKVDILSHFEFIDPRQALHINSLKMALRCTFEDQPHEDAQLGFFPITTVPSMHTVASRVEKFTAEKLAASTAVKLVIWLPIQGNYRFNLYHFASEIV